MSANVANDLLVRLEVLRKQGTDSISYFFDVLERLRKRRGTLVREIAKIKRQLGLPIGNVSRHNAVLEQVKSAVEGLGYKIPDSIVEAIVDWLFTDSLRIQTEELRQGEDE